MVPLAAGRGTPLGRRVAPGAAATVADLLDRWWNNYSGHEPGLRGGHWRYTGDRTTVFHLDGVRLAADLAVSGTATWHRYDGTLAVDLTVSAHGRHGTLHGSVGDAGQRSPGDAARGLRGPAGEGHVPGAVTVR